MHCPKQIFILGCLVIILSRWEMAPAVFVCTCLSCQSASKSQGYVEAPPWQVLPPCLLLCPPKLVMYPVTAVQGMCGGAGHGAEATVLWIGSYFQVQLFSSSYDVIIINLLKDRTALVSCTIPLIMRSALFLPELCVIYKQFIQLNSIMLKGTDRIARPNCL